MIIGIPKETLSGEHRVAMVPVSMPPLAKTGHRFVVESGAGTAAGFPDAAYAEKQAELVGPHVDEAIARGGVKGIWMQIGIADEAAARRAEAAGIRVVMDRCLMVDHAALLGR